MRYIKDTVVGSPKESERELAGDSERVQEDTAEGKVKESVARDSSMVGSRHGSLDPLMWAAFNETPQNNSMKETQCNMDHIAWWVFVCVCVHLSCIKTFYYVLLS